MLRPMYAILTSLTKKEPELLYWPYDTMQLTQGEVQNMAASVDLTLIDVIRPDQVPEGTPE